MKILHISHAKEKSGWGIAAQKDLKTLAKYFNVAARYITYSTNCFENSELDEFEKIDLEGVTHVIQYVLPHEFQRFPNAKNIGYFEVESMDMKYSLWPECLNVLDEVWVVNNDALEYIKKITDKPVYVIPHAIDTDLYTKPYKPIDIKQMRSNYIFYTIGENVPRKNLETIIAAYYLEFDPTEPCSLIIKTNEKIHDLIKNIQAKLRLYPKYTDYAQIAVIDGHITEEQIYGIHKLGDCYVNISSGESWCLPLIDAIGFKNNVISINEGGPADILNGSGYLLPYHETWCFGHNSFPGFQNGFDTWKTVDFPSLKQAMRKSYLERPQISTNILDKFNENNFYTKIKERM